MNPKFKFKINSSLDISKSDRNEIDFLRTTIIVDYEIFPNLLTTLKNMDSVYQRNKLLKDTISFGTNFNIGGIIIPGKITFFYFRIEMKQIISNNKININSNSCCLKGKIKTGLVVLKGKIINNIKSGITRENSSCHLEIDWHGKTTIEIQFSFLLKFELDKNEERSLKKPFRKLVQKRKKDLSIEFWLSCKIYYNFFILKYLFLLNI